MKIHEIHYARRYKDQYRALPVHIRKKVIKQETIFVENPFHPSLRLHRLQGKLEGLWSISIDRSYRIIFKPLANGNMLFISIGRHAIYGR